MASVASSYARAFADVVIARGWTPTARSAELQQHGRSAVDESVELRRVWENPAVPAEQKRKFWM